VVLTDFGIARAADSPTLTADGALLGSPSYIAPERARNGHSVAGPPGDLWGLGASLYTAVEGHPPFDRDGALATLTAVVADEPDQALHAGPLEPVISGLLRKDPGQRLGSAEAERLLRQVAGQHAQPLAASAPPDALPPADLEPWQPAPPPGPGRSRGRLLTMAVLFAAVASVTGLAFALTSSPRQQTSAPGGPRPATASSHAAASHPASPAPSPTATPSARTSRAQASPSGSVPPGTAGASSTGSAAKGALPVGYYRFTNATGFSIGVPDGWSISHKGHYVYVTDPANSNVYLLIDQSDHPKPDPLADWEQQQANRGGSYPGYHLISLRSVNYPQAEKAADWEFTYVRNGVLLHVLNRNILANASHAYALYWSTPESDWSADYHYFQAFAATFRPAPPAPPKSDSGKKPPKADAGKKPPKPDNGKKPSGHSESD
jgi:hypothetical protein